MRLSFQLSTLFFLIAMASVEPFSLIPHHTLEVGGLTKSATNDPRMEMSRKLFFQSSFATLVAASPALAKEEENTKGTKKDPAFEACLSSCLYTCTKPKGLEQKSRSECLPECKAKCATTKAQLMTGTPIKKD